MNDDQQARDLAELEALLNQVSGAAGIDPIQQSAAIQDPNQVQSLDQTQTQIQQPSAATSAQTDSLLIPSINQVANQNADANNTDLSLEDELDEVEALLGKVSEPENPVGTVQKEALVGQPHREYSFKAAEAAPTVENKDQEKILELETAIDSFVQKSNQLKQAQGGNVTIGAGQTALNPNSYQQQPTIVLPITKEQEAEGARKDPGFGLRWLVTFTRKLKKLFAGRFTYKTVNVEKPDPIPSQEPISQTEPPLTQT